ncbi:MAG: signal transduction histidine kinase, partial [Deltaproteobacteria bacterium]|nr:signal transduction histidine kinase [Deltaproteobacteria bacterium]
MKDEGKFVFLSGLSRTAMTRRIVFLVLLGGVLGLGIFTTYSASRWSGRPFPGFLVTPRLSISGVGLYNWTGTTAGLISYDVILKADDRDLGSQKELYEYASRRAQGEPIRYTIKRDGRIFEAAIAPMRFTLTDLLFLYGSYFLAGFVFVALGAIIFFLKPDTHLSWISFIITLAMAVYYFSMFDMVSTNVGLYRAYIFTAGFASFAQLHFCLYFPEKARFVDRIPRLQYLPFALAALHITIMEATYPDPTFVTFWKLNPLLAGLTTVILLGTLLRSFFRGRSAIARQRAKVVLLGAGIAFPISNFLLVLGSAFSGSVGKYPILNNYVVLPSLVFPVSIAYAIAKHNLFDVDVFIKRTVGYAIMTAVVGTVYLGLQVGLESIVLVPVFGSAARKFTPVLFAFLVVFLFNPLNRMVQDGVDRMFYRKKFDYKVTVTAVSEALSSVLNLDEIVRMIVHTVRSDMFIDRSGLVLAGAQGERLPSYFVGDDSSGGSEEIRSDALPADDPLVELVREKKKLVTRYDVAEDPYFADVRETCGRRFEELGASLAVPLVYQGEVKAVLAVGHKKSGHFFTREDIELLQTLASHGAVAIESANLAEQMKKE